jgi:hypothetical protein
VSKGLVTAKKPGTAVVQAIIKVKPAGAKKAITLPAASCTIIVKATENDKPKNKKNDKTYKLALSKSTLKINRTTKAEQGLTIKLTPKKPLTVEQLISGNEITVDSTNYDVVEVSELGDLKADSKGKTARAALKLTAVGPGTAYIIVKSKQGEGQENIAVCKITVTTPVGSIKIVGDANKLIPEDASDTGEIMIKMKRGSYDRLYYEIDPTDTTDIGKIKWSAKGGVTVKNGIIFAKKVSKKKGASVKPATVTIKCGKKSHTIKIVVE